MSARPCVCPSVCLSVVENLSPEGVFDKRVDIRLKPGVDGVGGGILDQTLGKLEWHQKKSITPHMNGVSVYSISY